MKKEAPQLVPANVKTSRIVSQPQLEELLRLGEQQRRDDNARHEVIKLLEDGSEIEPGPLS